MKEQDIRERIQTFLKETVRYVVVPASVGLGLALIGGPGCGSSDSSDDTGNGTITLASTSTGTGTGTDSVARYQAPMNTDSATNTGTGAIATQTKTSTSTVTNSVVKYQGAMPDAGQIYPDYMAPQPTVTKTTTGTAVAVYSAPITETHTKIGTGTGTGSASTSSSTGTSTGSVATATKTSMVTGLLYMAVMPDAGFVEKYGAPIPADAGLAQPEYMAPQPTVTKITTSTAVAVYSAPLTTMKTGTSTGVGTNPIARYHAIQPSADSPTPSPSADTLYAAPKLTGK